ncbi:MAG TPA: CHRD domain-containing protein, partial [Blastocatellia bacterium]|nr:CHRD domain-containing protein [Blastocatellia bacterium]
MTLTRRFSVAVMAVFCILALSVVTKAETITLTAVLSGANEVPPRQSNGSGAATVILNDVTGQGSLSVGFTGLSAAV